MNAPPNVDKPHLHPQILQTSSKVFSESMPVLYRNAEIKAILPICDAEGRSRIPSGLNQWPLYALPHIEHLWFTTEGFRWKALRYWFHSSLGFSVGDWDCLLESVPKLRSLKLHMEVSRDDLKHIDWAVYEALAKLPRLQYVEFRIMCDEFYHFPMAELDELAVQLQQRVEGKAKGMGKTLEVYLFEVTKDMWEAALV